MLLFHIKSVEEKVCIALYVHVCFDFQTHCVLNRSAFLFMSNYVLHNFSGRQICFDLDMEL